MAIIWKIKFCIIHISVYFWTGSYLRRLQREVTVSISELGRYYKLTFGAVASSEDFTEKIV